VQVMGEIFIQPALPLQSARYCCGFV